MMDITGKCILRLMVILVCTETSQAESTACQFAKVDSISNMVRLELPLASKRSSCFCSLSSDSRSTQLDVKLNGTQGSDMSNDCGPYLRLERGTASHFHICPSHDWQKVTVRQNSNLTAAYWMDSASSHEPEIWFSNVASFEMRCIEMDSAFISADTVYCPCLSLRPSVSSSVKNIDQSFSLKCGLAVGISILVVCGLLVLVLCLNKRYRFIKCLTKNGDIDSKALATQQTDNTAYQTSNGYEELPYDLPANCSHGSPPEKAITKQGGYLNKAFTPETHNKNSMKDSFEQAPDLEIQPYASFSEVHQRLSCQQLVGRGALKEISSFDYKPPAYVTLSTPKTGPSIENPRAGLDSCNIYASVIKPRPVVLPNQPMIISPQENAVNGLDSIYGKVNKPPKSNLTALPVERLGQDRILSDSSKA